MTKKSKCFGCKNNPFYLHHADEKKTKILIIDNLIFGYCYDCREPII